MIPNARLRSAIDNVYAAFEDYPQPMQLDTSPLRDKAELKAIEVRPRGSLGTTDLCNYASWAMTTVGDVEQYKYFLPRILELATESGLIEPEVIALKLEYGAWRSWPPREKTAVEELFRRTFAQALMEHPDNFDAVSWFCGMAILGFDLGGLLRAWDATNNSAATLQLAQLIRTLAFPGKEASERGYWESVPDDVEKELLNWLTSQHTRLRLRVAKGIANPSDIWILERAAEMLEQFNQRRG